MMYLSYSGWSTLDNCNFEYWNKYVNLTEVPPEDRLGSVFGSVTGGLFEVFYEESLWKEDQPVGALSDRVDAMVAKVLKEETSPRKMRPAGVLRWKGKGPGQNPRGMYASPEALAADVRDAVARGIRIIRHHRLIGPIAKAEVKLDQEIDGVCVAGRTDFIIARTDPYRDLVILDGKGSKHRGAYVDENQLRWYDMLFRRKTGHAPDKLGFVYWRYEPEEALDWFDSDSDKCSELLSKVLRDAAMIEAGIEKAPKGTPFEEARKVFLPRAEDPNAKDKASVCRFCPYATEQICPAGFEVRDTK
jgi:hypothetical protein